MYNKVMMNQKSLIQGNVGEELKNKFDDQIGQQGFFVGRVVESMVRLWVELPPDTQSKLYGRPTDNILKLTVEGIVQEYMQSLSPQQQEIVQADIAKTKRKIARKR